MQKKVNAYHGTEVKRQERERVSVRNAHRTKNTHLMCPKMHGISKKWTCEWVWGQYIQG